MRLGVVASCWQAPVVSADSGVASGDSACLAAHAPFGAPVFLDTIRTVARTGEGREQLRIGRGGCVVRTCEPGDDVCLSVPRAGRRW